MRRARDETAWEIGGRDEVAWIAAKTRPGLTTFAAIPPVFGAYATVIVPEPRMPCGRRTRPSWRCYARSNQQPWWLGYLETGVADLVFPKAPKVRLYARWPYVLVKAGPDEAAAWRTNDDATPWHSALPDLMFPLDHSRLVTALWDDDWRCIGGCTSLVEAILQHPGIDAYAVGLDEDATPPGH